MDKLPRNQLKVYRKQEIVEEQKKKLSPASFQLLTSQSGIAAGTLLVQQRN